MTAPPPGLPLCVDLDGALVRTDTRMEALLRALKADPLVALRLPAWALGGSARIARELAARAALDPAALPYHAEVLARLERERAGGRKLVLVSAADEGLTRAVSAHLGVFDDVVTSGDTRGALAARYGAEGFDVADRPPATSRLAAALRSLRAHQWVKNLLVFVPLLMSPEARNFALLWNAFLAFAAFSLCASAVYVLNDLLDLDADRRHPTKRRRPFASGDLPLGAGLLLAPACLGAGLLVAALLPAAFAVVLLLYLVATTAYSFRLKQVPILDVIVLALLYTGRVIAGSAATFLWPSPWILAFSLFFFVSLAFVKRYSELEALRRIDPRAAAARGYAATDLEWIASGGTASGYVSVLVAALYINSERVAAVYERPELLWIVCPLLLYWISRVWLLARRGEMHDDPVLFAVRDRASWVVGALLGATLVAAQTG